MAADAALKTLSEEGSVIGTEIIQGIRDLVGQSTRLFKLLYTHASHARVAGFLVEVQEFSRADSHVHYLNLVDLQILPLALSAQVRRFLGKVKGFFTEVQRLFGKRSGSALGKIKLCLTPGKDETLKRLEETLAALQNELEELLKTPELENQKGVFSPMFKRGGGGGGATGGVGGTAGAGGPGRAAQPLGSGTSGSSIGSNAGQSTSPVTSLSLAEFDKILSGERPFATKVCINLKDLLELPDGDEGIALAEIVDRGDEGVDLYFPPSSTITVSAFEDLAHTFLEEGEASSLLANLVLDTEGSTPSDAAKSASQGKNGKKEILDLPRAFSCRALILAFSAAFFTGITQTLSPLEAGGDILEWKRQKQTFTIGSLGDSHVAVACNSTALRFAIENFKPRVVVKLGTASTSPSFKSEIGDFILSESIGVFENDDDGEDEDDEEERLMFIPNYTIKVEKLLLDAFEKALQANRITVTRKPIISCQDGPNKALFLKNRSEACGADVEGLEVYTTIQKENNAIKKRNETIRKERSLQCISLNATGNQGNLLPEVALSIAQALSIYRSEEPELSESVMEEYVITGPSLASSTDE